MLISLCAVISISGQPRVGTYPLMATGTANCLTVIFWTLLTAFYAAAFEIEIKPREDKFVRALGTNSVFSCHVIGAGSSDAHIQWVDQLSNPIPENLGSRIYVERGSDNTRKLYITSIDEKDAGKYSCSVKVGDSQPMEKSIELFIFKDITFDHAPNPQHPKIYCDARIECHVTGHPTPVVSWRYNGKPVEGGRYIKEQGGLLIKNMTQADDGNYTCRAEVEVDGRYDERRITVIVHIPPVVTDGPGNIEGIEGQDVTLSCKATGFPSPKFEFHKEHKNKSRKVLAPSDRIHIDADAGRVQFRPLKKDDEGHYVCTALNDVGDRDGSGSLTVYVPPKVQDLKNLTLVEGGHAAIPCKFVGDPKPEVTFHKVGNKEEYKTGPNDDGRIVVASKGPGHFELQLKKISPADVGTYVCKAHNKVGQHSSAGSISVLFKPRFPKEQTNLVYSWAGRVHNVTCMPQGEPAPKIEWRRFDRLLENNDTFRIFDLGNTSNLQVRVKEADQSWIYGDYFCRAKNEQGHTDFKIVLTRATVPDAPKKVVVKENYPNLILLSIEPPGENGGVQLVGYRVEYDNKVQDVSILDTDSRGNKTQKFSDMKIENLRPGTQYVFRIRAKNEVGVGNQIEQVIITPNTSKPFPIQLTSPRQGQKPHEYKVTWEKPRTGGEPISQYDIRYKKIRFLNDGSYESEEDWKIDVMPDNKDKPLLEYMLGGLSPSTDYMLQVLAMNKLGYSKPEGEFIFKTRAVAAPFMYSSARSRHNFYELFWLPSTVVITAIVSQWTSVA